MKLIDLLVQELPKRGGWPEGAAECERYLHEGNIDFYDTEGNWPEDCGEKYGYDFAESLVQPKITGIGVKTETVSVEQYKSALAASHHPAWNGEGLPPVGSECEWLASGDHDWIGVKVLAYHEDEVWLKPLNGAQSFTVGNPDDFRPIRSEAEHKRDEIVNGISCMLEACDHREGSSVSTAVYIYDAIAAGQIPGIKLDGDA